MEQTERLKGAAGSILLKVLLKWIGLPILALLLVFGIIMIAVLVYQNESNTSGVAGGEPTELALQMIPAEYIPIYQAAEKTYGVPWNLLAAHHKVETDFSRIKVMVSPVGAQGHMQFMPLTWLGWSYPGGNRLGNAAIPKEVLTSPAAIKKYGGYGVDANGDKKADPYDLEDAIFSAANYLAANGAAEGNIEKAVFAYNHADWYVKEVLDYANTFASMGAAPVSAEGIAWPVPFTQNITSHFTDRINPVTGKAEFHNGLDIAAAGVNGKPVVAFMSGKVLHSGYVGGYGQTVIIQHEGGYESLYGHLSGLSVKPGQQVKAGDVIGAVGSTGRSTGPHLHFTVEKNGTAINPMTFFSK